MTPEESASPPLRADSARARTRRGAVCTTCRQAKQQCDAAELAPAPCTRCSKFGRHCAIDPTFRRVKKRSHVNALETDTQGAEIGQESFAEVASQASGQPARSSSIALPLYCAHIRPQRLENVQISSVDIVNLIQQFYSIYHPQFPILPDIMTFVQQYNSNRLLLWSILAISAGNSSVTSALYNSLVNPVRRLAGDIYSHQSRGLEAVQALLLLCAWPFPYQQTVNDPSPMYCSLATAIAHQIGLHRPPALSNDFDFQVDGPESSRVKVRDRERAWLGCFVMNYTISIRLGIPSPISSYRSISSAIAKEPPSHLADTLIGLVHVAYLGHKTTTALGDDASAPSGLVDDPARLIHFFDHDFQAACQSLHGKISSQCDVFLLHSRLTLYSYAFNDKGTQNPNQPYDVEKSELSGKALSAAMKLMQLACENFNASLRWPAFVKNCVIYATCLAAFIVSKVKQSAIEVKTIIDTCEAANSLIRLWSLFPKDNYSRISTHIARFIDSINQRTSFMMTTPEDTRGGLARQTPVTSRMSANVMFNVIWPAKKAGMNGTAPTLGDEAQPVVHPLVNTMMEEEDAHDTGLPTQVNLGPMDTIDFGSFDDIFADWSDLLGNTT